ncbi:MAG: carbohydrate-binding family 9-like protein [Deltaproteobacteria bacterium]|nr:carbohydrate-binding family 9-like protein [Deltaproteobacteria bacterium]
MTKLQRVVRSAGSVFLASVGLGLGCVSERQPSTILAEPPASVRARLEAQQHLVDRTLGGGGVRYLGFEALPEGALPGSEVRVVHYWVAERPVDRPYRVFVHALVDGAFGLIPHGDHAPIPSPEHWPVGKVIRDEHSLSLPELLPAAAVELRVGLYEGDRRLPVDDPASQDGQDRLRAGRFKVAGTPMPRPVYQASKVREAPLIDGKLDDAAWTSGPWIEGFLLSRGDRPSRLETAVNVVWDDTRVYVAFKAEDPDLRATYRNRDEPIYREEAVEMFIDPTASGKSYIELQTSPAGVVFDARFKGGPRQGFDSRYDAGLVAAVAARGTLNDSTDKDDGFGVEWALDLATVPDAVAPIARGSCWKVNFFRIAKDQAGGAVIADESAWSPPLAGDFHNLERFGDLCFSDGGDRAARTSR